MSSRKRSFRAVEGEGESEPSPLHRIRNMWQFANLCQWIYMFGKAAKIDESIEIEEIETECLKSDSSLLNDIGLALLKLVSSHRGLTHDIFNDQARKQYLAKAPERNPFGNDEVASNFTEFSVFTKIRVLQQFTQWVMLHPDRIRDRMEEQKDVEQTNWRIEPYGWDANDRTYFVLDDNRVYRLTDAPAPPPPKPKKQKATRSGRRSSKRRRTTQASEDEFLRQEDDNQEHTEVEDDGLGGMTWECLAVTLHDVRNIVEGFRKSRDENEKILRKQLVDHLVPILEKQEEAQKRKEAQRERELLNLAKMANAKRSSRLAKKAEQQKEGEREREEEQQRRDVEAATRREEEAQLKTEQERNRRLHSREKRLRDREARRLQNEDELTQLSEDSKNMTDGNGRASERRLKAEIERRKQALKDLEEEEEDWVFDCVCGLYGQIDDGTHSVACERCNIWQHSKCLGISEEEAERSEFHFVCASCRHREDHPRPTIKLKLHRPGIPTTTHLQDHPQPNAAANQSPTALNLEPAAKQQLPNGLREGMESRANVVSNVLHPHEQLSLGLESNVSRSTESPTKTDLGKKDAQHDEVVGDGNSHHPPITSTPVALTGPTNGTYGIQGDRAIESALSTPGISRDIYRAAYVQNGTLPAQAGLSPTKQSPPRPIEQASANKISRTTPILPPVPSLSPSPPQQVLTPPSKHAEPVRPHSGRSTGSKNPRIPVSPDALRNCAPNQTKGKLITGLGSAKSKRPE